MDGDDSDNVVDIYEAYEVYLNHMDLKKMDPKNYHVYRLMFHTSIQPIDKEKKARREER